MKGHARIPQNGDRIRLTQAIQRAGKVFPQGSLGAVVSPKGKISSQVFSVKLDDYDTIIKIFWDETEILEE